MERRYEWSEPAKRPVLDRAQVTRRGRRREVWRLVAVVAVLFLLQQPLRVAALDAMEGQLGWWETLWSRELETGLGTEIPLCLSLVLDFFMIYAYVLLAHRTLGLARAYGVAGWAERVGQFGLFLVMVGGALDVVENTRLWFRADGPEATLSLGWSSVAMRGTVLAGFLAIAVALVVAVVRRTEAGAESRRVPAATARTEQPETVICCSGGGIRAASFSLGGLQVLTERNIYQDASAIIGVSGGGYIAAAHHVARWQSAPDRESNETWAPLDPPAFASAEPGRGWPSSPELHWVRRHTRYILDSMRALVQGALSLAFGIGVNLLVLAVAIGTTAWLLGWMLLESGRLVPWDVVIDSTVAPGSALTADTATKVVTEGIGGGSAEGWTDLSFVWVLPLVGIGLFVLEKILDRFVTVTFAVRQGMRSASTALVAGGGAVALLVLGVPWLLEQLEEYAAASASAFSQLVAALGLIPADVCNQLVDAGQDACGVEGLDDATTVSARAPVGSVVAIVSSILAVLAAANGSAVSKDVKDKNIVSTVLGKVWAKIKDPVVPWVAAVVIALVLVVLLLRWTAHLVADPGLLDEWRYAYWFGALLLGARVLTEPNRTSLHHFFRERISYAFLVRRVGLDVEPVPYRRKLRFSLAAPGEMVGEQGVQENPTDLGRQADRRPREERGPSLVSCAVANVNDQDLVPAKRGCVPFVFSHEEIGLTDRLLPRAAAMRRSSTYEFAADHRFRDATIPAAAAVSAAAFSPMAGRENIKLGPFRTVLALGNARLGIWLPNPLWLDERELCRKLVRRRIAAEALQAWRDLPCDEASDLARRLRGTDRSWLRAVVGNSPSYAHQVDDHPGGCGHRSLLREDARAAPARWMTRLWFVWDELCGLVFDKPGLTWQVKEAVGRASILDRFLYVTDGGHFDNLGLIEALRRRPQRVYVLDASNDPEDTFRTLGRAVATARMDLGCTVDIDPRQMRKLKSKRAAAAWCVGSVLYDDGSRGMIFLAKAVMVDGAPWDVETYQADNAVFPRTSTSKQLYSEFDFEAYRMLGRHTVERLLESADYAKAVQQQSEGAGGPAPG